MPPNEDVIWKASGTNSHTMTSVPTWLKEFVRLIYRLLWICLLAYWSVQFVGIIQDYRGNPDRVLADIKSFLWPLIGYGILAILFLKFRHTFDPSSVTTTSASGIPLWLSREQVGFAPAQNVTTNLISVDDIQSLKMDFCEGAPAITVRLSGKTLTLISSEAQVLLRHLYTLRPNLEPTP